jgi:diacylglycerol diphosphate phosphatase/phosphatidate phosphatase
MATPAAAPTASFDRHGDDDEDAVEKTPLYYAKRARLAEWGMGLALLVTAMLIGFLAKPHCRQFQWDDATINKALKPDVFPTWSLPLMVIAPVPLYVASTVAFPQYPAQLWPELNNLALLQLFSIAFAEAMSEPTKIYAGRLRPDFLSRLRHAGYSPATANATSYCDIRDSHVEQGRKSFPSGHTSTTFAGMTPLTFFLVNRLRAFSRGSFPLLVLSTLPMILAFVVAVSRTREEWHNFSDVLAGAVIGVAAGAAAYRLLFVSREQCATQPKGGDTAPRLLAMEHRYAATAVTAAV